MVQGTMVLSHALPEDEDVGGGSLLSTLLAMSPPAPARQAADETIVSPLAPADGTLVVGRASPAMQSMVTAVPTSGQTALASDTRTETGTSTAAGTRTETGTSTRTATGTTTSTMGATTDSSRASSVISVEPKRSTARAAQRALNIPLSPMMRLVVDWHLVDVYKMEALVDYARLSSMTLFRALAEDPTIRFKKDIFALVAEETGVPYLKEEAEVRAIVNPVPWLELGFARSLGIVPLRSDTAAVFRYATIDPFNVILADLLLGLARREAPEVERVEAVLISSETLQAEIQRLQALSETGEESAIGVAIDISLEQERHMAADLENIDVPEVVNFFIHRAYAEGASDIHVEPTETSLLVRNRVDGILHDDSTLPMAMQPEVGSRIKIISGMDVAEKRRPQDGRISAVVRGSPLDVRVSTYPTVYGEKVVMRLLDKNALRPSVQAVGLMPRNLRLLVDKINAPFGLIMISGPTGSGKTTTLYSCLGSIDKKAKNVLTVEDPVEYRLAGVHQMQVNDKIGLTFASGLRTILRQDPDVIMVGECRDSETASMAIQAALTEHIVFSTIHTNDSVGVVTRLLDMGIDAFLVANAVSVALAQRLVRKVCPHCRVEVMGSEVLQNLKADGISESRLAKLGIEIDPDIEYVHGVGCVHCRNRGYYGRQPVFEMFEMTHAARALVMSPTFNADDLRRLARESGMMTLVQHSLRLVEEGVTTHEEVIRVLGETT